MTQTFENLSAATLRAQTALRTADPQGVAGDVGHLSRALEQWIADEGWVFSCQGIELSAEEMAAPDGLLPIVLLQAQDCLARATGAAVPKSVEHAESETGLCGVSVSKLRSMSIGQWLLCASFALEERVKAHGISGPIPVDGWYENWQKALEAEAVVVLDAAPTPSQPGVTVRS